MVNLTVEYSDKPVTAFGGMRLMKDFIDKIGVRPFLEELQLPQGGSNRAYNPVDVVEAFLLNIWIGASRFCHCDWIREDAVLKEIFGMSSLPSQSTYSRFFGKFSQASNNRIFPQLQHWTLQPIDTGALTMDFDSTVDHSQRQPRRHRSRLQSQPPRPQQPSSAHGLRQPDAYGGQRLASSRQHRSV